MPVQPGEVLKPYLKLPSSQAPEEGEAGWRQTHGRSLWNWVASFGNCYTMR